MIVGKVIGADIYLNKPFEIADLIRKIKSLLHES